MEIDWANPDLRLLEQIYLSESAMRRNALFIHEKVFRMYPRPGTYGKALENCLYCEWLDTCRAFELVVIPRQIADKSIEFNERGLEKLRRNNVLFI